MPGCRVGLRRSAPTYGKRYSALEVVPRRCAIQIHDFSFFLLSQNRHTHITINTQWITTTRMQTVKGQGHTKPKLDLEPWRRHHSRLVRSISLLAWLAVSWAWASYGRSSLVGTCYLKTWLAERRPAKHSVSTSTRSSTIQFTGKTWLRDANRAV